MNREERIAGLKYLAALMPKASDRMACFREILAERSKQLAEEIGRASEQEAHDGT